MSIIQAIQDFFESIFNRNSPEVQKKLLLKKLENELKNYQPLIFKNGNLLPNFAEAIRHLYINAKVINNILDCTINGSDVQRSKRFEAQLVLTGFSPEYQQLIDSLNYEKRKIEINSKSSMTTSQLYDQQHRRLEKIIKELGNNSFSQIDKNLRTLHQLSDLCSYNFVTILQIFDPNFISADLHYQPAYKEIPVTQIQNILEDLYYQINGLQITISTSNALSALVSLKNNTGNRFDADTITDSLKKIAYVINHILQPEKIKLLLQYAKADTNYNPKSVEYNESARKNFSEMLQARFKADEQRIKTEMKDENIRSEIEKLFGSSNLLNLRGYNNTVSSKLTKETQFSFLWIIPLGVIKTFVETYLTEPICALLNNLVIEGFFNNPQVKTDFSADIYKALEAKDALEEFEHNFDRGERWDINLIEGYIKDSHKDQDFLKKLEHMVNEINNEASKVIGTQVRALNILNHHIDAILIDSKKPTSEIISNLKVLMMSSRNRDSSDLLEQQYPRWSIFFNIMKNYAIMNG